MCEPKLCATVIMSTRVVGLTRVFQRSPPVFCLIHKTKCNVSILMFCTFRQKKHMKRTWMEHHSEYEVACAKNGKEYQPFFQMRRIQAIYELVWAILSTTAKVCMCPVLAHSQTALHIRRKQAPKSTSILAYAQLASWYIHSILKATRYLGR